MLLAATSLAALTLCTQQATEAARAKPVQGSDLAAVLRAEDVRIQTMASVEPSVCSVMKIGSPGGGSGVIFDPAGFVLTNFHVVGKVEQHRMRIGMTDGNLYDATVLGVDPGSDLAVLLLDSEARDEPWPAAALGDSDALLVGETVFAMGNPFLLATDFKPTVTWGIVSGTHRYQPGRGNRSLVYPDCIQVDVPVNPGNSGGPLFNDRGEIVGINGRISVRDRGRVNVGVGFAIASNQIRNFLGDLVAGRHAEHGTLDLNAWFRRAPGIRPERHGVFVQALFEDSKVTELGLSLGDELLRFNDIEIRSANQLATLVGVLPTGTWVTLGFRPKLEEAYGEPREIEFQLATLDTGSSADEHRLASEQHRTRAMDIVLRGIPRTDVAAGADLSIRGPKGRIVRLRRSGEMLRIDDSKTETTLVHRAGGEGFRVDANGTVSELSLDESTKLARVLSTNPWLRASAGVLKLLEHGMLVGGTMVQQRPAWVVDLPGQGNRQIYIYFDGSPAGCRYRDPVQKKLVELRLDADHSRIVTDGNTADGWSITPPVFAPQPGQLFAKP